MKPYEEVTNGQYRIHHVERNISRLKIMWRRKKISDTAYRSGKILNVKILTGQNIETFNCYNLQSLQYIPIHPTFRSLRLSDVRKYLQRATNTSWQRTRLLVMLRRSRPRYVIITRATQD